MPRRRRGRSPTRSHRPGSRSAPGRGMASPGTASPGPPSSRCRSTEPGAGERPWANPRSRDCAVGVLKPLAHESGLSRRPLDTANPQLDLRLPDGSRLSAVMDVTLRPAISIRRARMGKVFLADLVGNGTMSPDVASFLAAAVGARKNIMIAGSTNAGKTTLLRALANQIPAEERLITVERALEIGLDHFPDLHPNVVAFEQRLPNNEAQGAVSMAEIVRLPLRMNPSRGIVGEVPGADIVPML